MKQLPLNLTEKDIAAIGLTQSQEQINATISPSARIFRYPHLSEVYIMESDLYGNAMPAGSCFLAFSGRNGLVGKHVSIATLIGSSVEEIRAMVEANTDG